MMAARSTKKSAVSGKIVSIGWPEPLTKAITGGSAAASSE